MSASKQAVSAGGHKPYEIRISRLTIENLGVKLYDKVSAAVAELIANSYDADAEKVTVRLPFATALARKDPSTGLIVEPSPACTIEVEDNGHGMTPDEALEHYMCVGRDRRTQQDQGAVSREKRRPVMGRKGIGKLAPFGICQRIEVISSGGLKTANGYLTSHFFLDYAKIVQDTDVRVPLEAGDLDGTFRPRSGTLIRLTRFLAKKVEDETTVQRQIASRFVFAKPDFEILIHDNKPGAKAKPKRVEPLAIAKEKSTVLHLKDHPVKTESGEVLKVTGWLGMAKTSYKNEEMAGVRIYARNKIVATTRDFEQPAGFTGEFTIRSYLVGEVHAEWLDKDSGEDLIRSDRQGIIWESEYGRALRSWGADLIKEIGAISKAPRRKRTRDIFLAKSDFLDRAKKKFVDQRIFDVAVELAGQIGGFAAEDELEDADYVQGLADIILAVAPHKALIEAFQDFKSELKDGNKEPLETLVGLFGKARVAEMASYSQVIAERVTAIRELEKILDTKSDEGTLQRMIEKAPWLIDHTWTVISMNESLKTFAAAFRKFWKEKTKKDVTFSIGWSTKKPDFILISLGHALHIVEIKAPGHKFDQKDMERLAPYLSAFEEFFEKNSGLAEEFHNRWKVHLIADGTNLKKSPMSEHSFRLYEGKELLERISWYDFLHRAKTTHEEFLKINAKFERAARGSS